MERPVRRTWQDILHLRVDWVRGLPRVGLVRPLGEEHEEGDEMEMTQTMIFVLPNDGILGAGQSL